jgi:SPP1 gp7 family putative phage head morphogenesis protein
MKKTKGITGQEQASTLPGGGTPSIVLNQIDVRPFGRREQDIPSWRNALRGAESIIPRRTALYDLYADVELDGHVEAVTGKRRDAVTTANWQFVDKAGKPVDEINELIDSIGFNDMIEEIINSKFWGYSILEPTFHKSPDGTWEMEPNLLPRPNYRPEKGIVAYDFASDEGINIREGIYAKTIMEVGNPKDLGLYLKAAPFQILKRGGLGDWALFVQVFGNPLVDATWDGFDEKQRVQLLEAINALGSGGAIVRPSGTDITLIENKSNANGDLQDKFMTFLNREISKALLGSTETTESSTSSGYAQAETHAAQDERKNESDINFTRRVLNSRFIKILNTAGIDTKGGKFIVEGEDNELSIKESFEMQKEMVKELGLPIDDDFFYETYGIPKPANYDKLKKEKEDAAKRHSEQSEESPKTKKEKNQDPSVRHSERSEESQEEDEKLNFAAKIIKLFSGFFVQAPEAVAEGAETMKDCCGLTHTIQLKASMEPSLDKLIAAVLSAEGKLWIYPELVGHNATVLMTAFEAGWNGQELVQLVDLGITYGANDPRMQTAWEMNLFKFSTNKAAYQSAEVNRIFRNSRSFAEFERTIKKTFGVKYKPWLVSEYNTAYQTAEAASTYMRLKGQMNTFPYWQHKTIGDERVRDSHRALHDIILPADHPLWKKIFPPNGWGCRCYVVPRLATEVDPDQVAANIKYVEDYIATDPEWIKAKKDGFAVNRGDVQEVFTDTQSYTADGKVLSKANDMGAADWGLDPATVIQDRKSDKWDAETQAILDEIWNMHKVNDLSGELFDYRGRPIYLTRDMINAQPFDIARAASTEVITAPDEVYISGKSEFDTITYLKYYQNGPLKVAARLDATGKLQLIGWELVQNAEQVRRGLLIKV